MTEPTRVAGNGGCSDNPRPGGIGRTGNLVNDDDVDRLPQMLAFINLPKPMSERSVGVNHPFAQYRQTFWLHNITGTRTEVCGGAAPVQMLRFCRYLLRIIEDERETY